MSHFINVKVNTPQRLALPRFLFYRRLRNTQLGETV
jgi:hypothetical protein